MHQASESPVAPPDEWLSYEPVVRWAATVAMLCAFAAYALSWCACIRITQQIMPQPDGTLVGYQTTWHRGSWYMAYTVPFAPPAPPPLKDIEWVGFSGSPALTRGPAMSSLTRVSGAIVVLVVPFMLAGGLWAAHGKRVRESRRGMCAACGYDRRGLDGSAPCPECGKRPLPTAH